jgi:membrane-associated phospholipid phosphatase
MITLNAVAGLAGLFLLRSTIFQNWLPLAFIPLAYWQTGYFVLPVNQKLQSWLQSFDQKFLRSIRVRPTLTFWLELAYLLVYPLVPVGLIALYAVGAAEYAEEFWNVVLPPAYACYATFPFVQTLPPRAIEHHALWEPKRTKIRILNLFVLRHISIQANTFPSGHVAASLAIALELLRHAPITGFVFFVIANAIAAGAFQGRYHYGVDVVLGVALAVVSFVASL